jgi:hypothetical protein
LYRQSGITLRFGGSDPLDVKLKSASLRSPLTLLPQPQLYKLLVAEVSLNVDEKENIHLAA